MYNQCETYVLGIGGIFLKIFSTIIIITVVFALMKYLGESTKKHAAVVSEGTIILKMNQAYGVIGYIGIVCSAVIGVIASLGTVKSVQDLIIVIGLVLSFLALSMPLVLISKKMKIEVDEEKIKHFGITGKIKTIYWNEIKTVKFSKTALELSLITDKIKVKLHMHLIGFNDMVNIMKAKIDYSLYRDALIEIESVNNRINKGF
ncbi:hypothetical protein Bccel_0655 [Pseudobacteroides cellulosolvens ATCC 35603 = DSM 2933]|uniref:Uncharacterized protein n=2 Tax=Pseudobacteroides cellulosolvens TaxID=35825 RepID=A0A0L6JI53_9FIRM|nr:hypothetical protein Bccel_0655 [Pseudobacteroides cellulosolvens ATCC 35603 = DSM 2933]